MTSNDTVKMRPVFIWAPVQRCGTGLLQRLIASSRDVLIYGEDLFFAQFLPRALLGRSLARTESQAAVTRLAAGDYSGWYPAALPNLEKYSAALISAFYSICNVYSQDAGKAGFPRWGCKLPAFESKEHAIIRSLLPRSKHVFIYRNIEDVLRSIKARKWLGSLDDVRRITSQWTLQTALVLDNARHDPGMLPLRYESLCADKEAQTGKLCDFLEIDNIDCAVFDHRVNTFPGSSANGFSKSQYIEPEKLSSDEIHVMRSIAGDLPRILGYESSATSRQVTA